MTNQLKKFFCPLCPSECGLVAEVSLDDSCIIKTVPDRQDPVSKGYICPLGSRLNEIKWPILKEPLKRVNNELVPISWETAILEISSKLTDIIDTVGGDKIFYMQSPHYGRRVSSVYVLKFLERIGVKYYTNIGSMEVIEKALATLQVTGNTLYRPDVKNSQVHLIIGKNPWVTNGEPGTRANIKKISQDPSRTLIVIDPVLTDTAKLANIFIQIKPGTDAWFLLAAIKIMIECNFINYQWLDAHCRDYRDAFNILLEADVNECLSISGVQYDTAFKFSKSIYEATSFSFSCELGIEHNINSGLSSYLITALGVITGNFKNDGGMKRSEGLIFPTSFITSQLETPFTKDRQLTGITPAARLAENLYVSDEKKFSAIFIDEINPIKSYPNSLKIKEALEKIDLVILLDHTRSEISEFADYVLPTLDYASSYGITNTSVYIDDIIQLKRPILAPAGSAKTHYEIINLITDAMGVVGNNVIPYFKNLLEIDKIRFASELFRMFNEKDVTYLYIIYNTLGAEFEDPFISLVWWYLLKFRMTTSSEPISQSIEVADLQIHSLISNGYVQYVTPECILSPGSFKLALPYLQDITKLDKTILQSDKYKFVLSVGFKRSSGLNNVLGGTDNIFVEIQDADADKLLLVNGETVTVTTSTGAIDMPCKVVSHLQPGYIRVPFSKDMNTLTNTDNRKKLTPQYKFVFANITKKN